MSSRILVLGAHPGSGHQIKYKKARVVQAAKTEIHTEQKIKNIWRQRENKIKRWPDAALPHIKISQKILVNLTDFIKIEFKSLNHISNTHTSFKHLNQSTISLIAPDTQIGESKLIITHVQLISNKIWEFLVCVYQWAFEVLSCWRDKLSCCFKSRAQKNSSVI